MQCTHTPTTVLSFVITEILRTASINSHVDSKCFLYIKNTDLFLKADYSIYLRKKLLYNTILVLTFSENCVWLETEIDWFNKMTIYVKRFKL